MSSVNEGKRRQSEKLYHLAAVGPSIYRLSKDSPQTGTIPARHIHSNFLVNSIMSSYRSFRRAGLVLKGSAEQIHKTTLQKLISLFHRFTNEVISRTVVVIESMR